MSVQMFTGLVPQHISLTKKHVSQYDDELAQIDSLTDGTWLKLTYSSENYARVAQTGIRQAVNAKRRYRISIYKDLGDPKTIWVHKGYVTKNSMLNKS